MYSDNFSRTMLSSSVPPKGIRSAVLFHISISRSSVESDILRSEFLNNNLSSINTATAAMRIPGATCIAKLPKFTSPVSLMLGVLTIKILGGSPIAVARYIKLNIFLFASSKIVTCPAHVNKKDFGYNERLFFFIF